MRSDEFDLLYRQLREALEAEYRKVPWDGACIDRIAQDLLYLERTMVQAQRQGAFTMATPPSLAMPRAPLQA